MVTTRIHVFNVLPSLLLSAFVFACANSVFLYMYFSDQNVEMQIAVQLIAMAFGFVFIRGFFLWQSYAVVVTPQSITIQQGILRRRRQRIAVGMATVQVSQSLADRACNCGRLDVTEVNGIHHSIGPLADFRRVRRVLGI